MKSSRRPPPTASPSANRRVGERAKRRRYRHVLDVRVPASRRERRIHRREQVFGALRVGGLTAAAVLALAGGRTVLGRALDHGESLPVREIDVRTDGALTRPQILAQARVAVGDSLLGLDLAALRARLEELPQVTAAKVTRQLPDRLAIELSERVPLAWLSCPEAGVEARNTGSGCLVDGGARVFKCGVLRRSDFNLPVIRLSDPSLVRHGAVLTGDEAAAAMEVVRSVATVLPGAGWALDSVELVNSYSVRATFANGAQATFGTVGTRSLADQFGDLALAVAKAGDLGRTVRTINLIPERNIPVTFADGAGAAPAAAGSAPDPLQAERPDRRARSVRGILGTP
jgi:hypothetical protein